MKGGTLWQEFNLQRRDRIAGNTGRKRDSLPSWYPRLSPKSYPTVKLEIRENWKCYFKETQSRVRERWEGKLIETQ